LGPLLRYFNAGPTDQTKPSTSVGKENSTPQRQNHGQLTSDDDESYVWRTQSCSSVLWFLAWQAVQKLLFAVSKHFRFSGLFVASSDSLCVQASQASQVASCPNRISPNREWRWTSSLFRSPGHPIWMPCLRSEATLLVGQEEKGKVVIPRVHTNIVPLPFFLVSLNGKLSW
jgi:hypothetical protein